MTPDLFVYWLFFSKLPARKGCRINRRKAKNIMIDHNNIILKVATIDNAVEIYSLMQEVYNRLENKSLYVCDNLEFVKAHIAKEGFIVIACHKGNKIVGNFLFRYPDMQADNLGRDIGLDDEKLKKVVHMESVAVLPEYRGNALQSEMLRYGEKLIDQNRYQYFLATVSLDNAASYTTFQKNGYKLIKVKEKYGGLQRGILLKVTH